MIVVHSKTQEKSQVYTMDGRAALVGDEVAPEVDANEIYVALALQCNQLGLRVVDLVPVL